jgi:hypothetical protein
MLGGFNHRRNALMHGLRSLVLLPKLRSRLF